MFVIYWSTVKNKAQLNSKEGHVTVDRAERSSLTCSVVTGARTRSSELCIPRLQGPGWLEGMRLRRCQLHLGTASSHGVRPPVRKLLSNNYRIMHMWPSGAPVLQTCQKLLGVENDGNSTLVTPSDALPILANRGLLYTQQTTRTPLEGALELHQELDAVHRGAHEHSKPNRSPVRSCNCVCMTLRDIPCRDITVGF